MFHDTEWYVSLFHAHGRRLAPHGLALERPDVWAPDELSILDILNGDRAVWNHALGYVANEVLGARSANALLESPRLLRLIVVICRKPTFIIFYCGDEHFSNFLTIRSIKIIQASRRLLKFHDFTPVFVHVKRIVHGTIESDPVTLLDAAQRQNVRDSGWVIPNPSVSTQIPLPVSRFFPRRYIELSVQLILDAAVSEDWHYKKHQP